MLLQRIELWLRSKRDLVNEILVMRAVYRDQRNSLLRLTSALRASHAGYTLDVVLKELYSL